uniref:6-phosphofructo-2-kinase domain-containing protein n=1 Tax=Chaetoceros debilis TaxID=122233 RepID=A0A7S3PZQ0_9STRA|mmetsp:Transcript_11173/g.16255  ORF Transcript_11173/g.16255 Transcript_11173/m.16255 type:complete len:609 (+) Transcript_11173:111-1937(+)
MSSPVHKAPKDYYEQGSNKVAEVTAVAIKKLEQRRKLTSTSERVVIVLVGLPGRGKSFIARKLQTFLTWRGNECEVFNVGKYRRTVQAKIVEEEEEKAAKQSKEGIRQSVGACDASFFDSNNPRAAELRHRSAQLAMEDMLVWLDDFGPVREAECISRHGAKATVFRSRIAIFDATNSTRERRKWVLEEATDPIKRAGKKTGCIFVESVCDDEELLEENFRFKVQNSPDFRGMTESEAIADLRIRVQKYEEAYETVDDDAQSYIKIFNLSSKVLVNHIYGNMAKVIVPCLMSWNIGSRPIYLIRAGETGIDDEDTAEFASEPRRISRGDTLNPRGLFFRKGLAKFIDQEGREFAKKSEDALKMAFAPKKRALGTSIYGIAAPNLACFVDGEGEELKEKARIKETLPFACHVMSSTMPRAVETASWDTLPFVIHELPNLNPLDKGDFFGMELEEIKEKHQEWYELLENDPFMTRFPGGESYADLIHRLETCIIDLEQQVNMAAVVSHVSTLQVLMAYFRRSPVDKCTSIEVPLHTVIKFTPVAGGGWIETQHKIIPSMDLDTSEHVMSLHKTGQHTPIWGDHGNYNSYLRRATSDEDSYEKNSKEDFPF